MSNKLENMKMKHLLFFLCVFPLTLFAQVRLANESGPFLEICTDNYLVKIRKDNSGIEVTRDNRIIALSSDTALAFGYEGKRHSVTAIKSWKLRGKTLFVNTETTHEKINADLVIVFEPNQIVIDWKLPEFMIAQDVTLSFQLEPGKHWYGGPVVAGHNWPLETGETVFDHMLAHSNQATPFWITSSGVGYFMPTYENMGFRLNANKSGKFELFLKQSRSINLQFFVGKDIRQTFRLFAHAAGLPETVPPRGFFEKAQFNTWIEYLMEINQQKLIDYARKIRSNDLPCEVLMVDAGWTPVHGDYDFDFNKFPDPRAMIDEIHSMGFKLILWISPYLRKDSPSFDYLDKKGFLIKDSTGIQSGTIKWWGGSDYQVDMSNPAAFDWFLEQLRKLQRDYGVDGFKQDGGDAKYIPVEYKTFAGASPNLSADYWAKLGDYFEYNEYRVSWLMQSSGLVQRLRDKHNNWSRDKGLGSLIPHGLTNSMIGYPYFCPDMIGGGESKNFRDRENKNMNTEMFIRWTQASALMPMMQFSLAPWNLDEKSLAICRKYSQIHQQLGDYIYGLALNAAKTGDPIARPLFYDHHTDDNSYLVSDQFMLGELILVAPVLEQGAVERDIYLPPGTWKDFWSGDVFAGGKTVKDFPAPIETLPVFIKIN